MQVKDCIHLVSYNTTSFINFNSLFNLTKLYFDKYLEKYKSANVIHYKISSTIKIGNPKNIRITVDLENLDFHEARMSQEDLESIKKSIPDFVDTLVDFGFKREDILVTNW